MEISATNTEKWSPDAPSNQPESDGRAELEGGWMELRSCLDIPHIFIFAILLSTRPKVEMFSKT